MSKPAKSQWDFGGLFPGGQTRLRGETAPSPQARKILSVPELTARVKRLLPQVFSATTLPARQT